MSFPSADDKLASHSDPNETDIDATLSILESFDCPYWKNFTNQYQSNTRTSKNYV